MAKRKLSLKQRQTIRQDIRKGLGEKKKQSELLKAMAKKYGISTITARWYLKSVVNPSPKRRTPRKSLLNRLKGASLKLVQQVQSTAKKTLKRALEVKKLIPKWQIYVRKEASLRKAESKLKKTLQVVTSKAEELHRRIRGLSSG